MNFFKSRKTIFLVPILIWLFSQLFLLEPRFFYISIAFSFLLLAFAIKGMEKEQGSKNWPLFFFFPAILFLGVSLYAALISDYYWIQFILFLSASFTFYYLRNIYYFLNYGALERAEKLNNLMTISGFLSVFTLAATIYGLPTFLGLSFWPLFVLFIIFTTPLFFQSFVLGRLNILEKWPFFLASIFILAELTLVLYFLPLSFNILGFFVAIFYYLILMALRLTLKNNFSVHTMRWPLIFSSVIITILLLTARWF
ncbi:MAG: hypothetical protein WCT50_00780 [Patescibacteria group bacterium]|jgi:hypothetical protein